MQISMKDFEKSKEEYDEEIRKEERERILKLLQIQEDEDGNLFIDLTVPLKQFFNLKDDE